VEKRGSKSAEHWTLTLRRKRMLGKRKERVLQKVKKDEKPRTQDYRKNSGHLGGKETEQPLRASNSEKKSYGEKGERTLEGRKGRRAEMGN